MQCAVGIFQINVLILFFKSNSRETWQTIVCDEPVTW